MATPAKPFFRCRVVAMPGPHGSVRLHVHRRDGTVEIIPAPLGVTMSTADDVVATQAAGSDNIVLDIEPTSAA